jgi:hypothetical protein
MAAEVERAGIMAFVGCSVVPGISSLLIQYGHTEAKGTDVVRIFISPGTRHPRGKGSFACLLSTVGREFTIPAIGQQKKIKGWTGREQVSFPLPMGRRSVYFVVDVADYFLQPVQFGARTVEFKIGSELEFLNHCLTVTRWLKEVSGVAILDALVPMFRGVVRLASIFGTSQGGVMVEIAGAPAVGSPSVGLAVLAARRGEVIPAFLPALATEMILKGEVRFSGIAPLSSWLPRERFNAELRRRGIKFAVRHASSKDWSDCE